MAGAHRHIGRLPRTGEAHPRIVPRRRMAVAAVIEEVEQHLPTMVVVAEPLRTTVAEAGRLRRVAEVAMAVEAAGDAPPLAAATVAIAN